MSKPLTPDEIKKEEKTAQKLIEEAKKHLEAYKRRPNRVSFVQANEKGWLAFNRKLNALSGRNLAKSSDISKYVKNYPEAWGSAAMMYSRSTGELGVLPFSPSTTRDGLKILEKFIKAKAKRTK